MCAARIASMMREKIMMLHILEREALRKARGAILPINVVAAREPENKAIDSYALEYTSFYAF